MISSDSLFLENAFDIFNRIYFNNSLPRAVITIQSNSKSYGYFTTVEVWRDAQRNYHEINISAEYLSRNIENVLATLLHESIHLFCKVNGIQDTSNSGRYHNKRFRDEAQKRDLIIEYAKYIGWSVTKPTQRFIEVIKANGLYINIDHCRITGGSCTVPPSADSDGDNESKQVKKGSTRKYICRNCKTSVRATKAVNIICADCMDLMVKVGSHG